MVPNDEKLLDDVKRWRTNTQRESPLGSPNSTVGAIHNGVRPQHLAGPEVLARVCARCFREHEVVRDVIGAHPLRGPDH